MAREKNKKQNDPRTALYCGTSAQQRQQSEHSEVHWIEVAEWPLVDVHPDLVLVASWRQVPSLVDWRDVLAEVPEARARDDECRQALHVDPHFSV